MKEYQQIFVDSTILVYGFLPETIFIHIFAPTLKVAIHFTSKLTWFWIKRCGIYVNGINFWRAKYTNILVWSRKNCQAMGREINIIVLSSPKIKIILNRKDNKQPPRDQFSYENWPYLLLGLQLPVLTQLCMGLNETLPLPHREFGWLDLVQIFCKQSCTQACTHSTK